MPRWQLTGIHRVHLKPQEEADICFTITPRQMALIDEEGKCMLEPGKFEIFVGGSQPDSRSLYLTGTPAASAFFDVEGKATQMPY